MVTTKLFPCLLFVLHAQAYVIPNGQRRDGLPSLAGRDTDYVVVSGDTGDDIATAFGISFDDLESVNPDVNWWDLEIGQTLQIPDCTSATTSESAGGFFGASSTETASMPVTTSAEPMTTAPPSASDSSVAPTAAPTAAPTSSSSAVVTTTSTSETITASSSASATISGSTPVDTNSATVNAPNAVPTVNDSDGVGALPDTYNFFQGDGSTTDGWPDITSWVSFSDMWTANLPIIGVSCNFPSGSGTPNTAEETQEIHDSIQAVAQESQLDHRFILAIIMQESMGCVRVPTTSFSVANPGLMQSHAGIGSCNNGTGQQDPCPESEIIQMIEDGAQGTPSGDGLTQSLNDQTGFTGAQAFYRTARVYNSGSVPSDNDLGDPGATRCYATDVANRLVGWVTAPNTCTLDG